MVITRGFTLLLRWTARNITDTPPRVCAITIARASIIPSLKASEDRPWDVTIDYLLAFLEMNIGIVCASVPALKPFFIRYLPGLVSSHLSRCSRNTPGQDGPTTRSKGTLHMYHLNTVVETNRQRRRMQSRSYTIGSREDNGVVAVTINNKKGGGSTFMSSIGRSWTGVDDDDETRLWPSSSPHYFHQHSKSEDVVLDSGSVPVTTTRPMVVDLETVSAHTIEALHGGGAVHTASVSVDGSRSQQGAGISVLKETSVSYEQ